MPGRSTVLNWLAKGGAESKKRPELAQFLDQYARACEDRKETILDEMLEIADDSRNDYVTRLDRNGKSVLIFDPENVQRAKLRLEARKWWLARMEPRKHGRDY